MSAAPTELEIAAELGRLKSLAPRIRQQDAFGTSNRDQIDAQIAILEGTPLSSYEVDETDEDLDESDIETQNEIYNQAQIAYDWMTTGALADGELMSQSWEPLVVKPLVGEDS